MSICYENIQLYIYSDPVRERKVKYRPSKFILQIYVNKIIVLL